jgi:hypothetical protein
MVIFRYTVHTSEDAKSYILHPMIHSEDAGWYDNSKFYYHDGKYIFKYIDYRGTNQVFFEKSMVEKLTGWATKFKEDVDDLKLRVIKRRLMDAFNIDPKSKMCVDKSCEFCITKFFET